MPKKKKKKKVEQVFFSLSTPASQKKNFSLFYTNHARSLATTQRQILTRCALLRYTLRQKKKTHKKKQDEETFLAVFCMR